MLMVVALGMQHAVHHQVRCVFFQRFLLLVGFALQRMGERGKPLLEGLALGHRASTSASQACGSTFAPFSNTSKWRWLPVEKPSLPMPPMRNFRPDRSWTVRISFLNQPPIWAPVLPAWKETML